MFCNSCIRQSQNSHNANTNVSLTDKGSKFGTKVNDRQLAANETVAIHNGDVVMFGMQGSFKYVHIEY